MIYQIILTFVKKSWNYIKNDKRWFKLDKNGNNNSRDWKQKIKENKNIKFVIFFISKKNNYLYNDLKKQT